MGEPPVVYVVLRPQAALWVGRHAPWLRELRRAAEMARLAGRVGLAEELEEASAQLRAAGSWVPSAEVAEVAAAEAGPGLESPPSLDTAVVAGLLGVSERRVRMLAGSGALQGVKFSGRWIFDRSTVDDYLDLRRRSA